MSCQGVHISDRDLLLWIDRELTSEQKAQIEGRLNACDACQARVEVLRRSIVNFEEVYRSLPQSSDVNLPSRARLKAGLTEQGTRRRSAMVQMAALSAIAALMLLVAGTAVHSRGHGNEVDMPAVPNLSLTPGATSPVSTRDVCSGNLPMNDPAVPDPLKREVLKEYGLKDVANDSYQIDYLVTPQLGGAVTIRNLWPQPARRTIWNARAKDQLEDRLHALVCGGKLDLTTAQHELSENWVAAYKKYFGTDAPKAISRLAPRYFRGTRMMRCSVASSTAFREYGRG